MTGAAGAYDEFEYPGYAYPYTHPARLEMLGRMFGRRPAPAEHCRVLEVGCGDGGNAMAIAQTLPGAQVLGIDVAPTAIARGRELAAAAGLSNLELRVHDLSDQDSLTRLGPFDYLIAHGVYSWIPPAVRGALLDSCRRDLSPEGIAFISYNAYPGSYLRDMAHDILEYHLRGVTGAADRLAKARQLMQSIVAVENPTPYASVLRDHLQRMLTSSDALLVHDDLAPISTPFYFHEFMESAAAYGLQFLCEADLGESKMSNVPESVAAFIGGLPTDIVLREQYFDFFSNRMFRQTLLVRDGLEVERTLDDQVIEHVFLSSPARRTEEGFVSPVGHLMQTTDALVSAAMEKICERWPQSVAFAELMTWAAERLGSTPSSEHRQNLRQMLIQGYIAHFVQLAGCPSQAVRDPGELPYASPLARAQCRAGRSLLTTLQPVNYQLEADVDGALLVLLDGTRDRRRLAEELSEDAESTEVSLSRLARAGLLMRAP